MKCTLLVEQLQKRLSFVSHGVSLRSQLPILLNILLETKNGKLIVSSTDLEIGIKITIPVTVEEEGITTVPAKNFFELIAMLSQGKIVLQTTEGGLMVTTQTLKSVFQTTEASEFPSLYQEKGEKILTLSKNLIHNDLPKVIFSASVDAGRPALTGILLKKAGEEFLFVGTDGYRLSLKKTKEKVTETQKEDFTLLIPARVLRELIAIKDEEKEVVVYISAQSNQIIFEEKDMLLVGRLIDAQFPTYEKIIPQDHETSIVFEREELQKAVRICSIFARETANIIKLSLRKGKIIVSANTPSVGENTVDVEGKLQGEENEIAFNARYLLDLLSAIEEEEMVFKMTGPLNPGVFTLVNDDSFLHLIMPIRVQG